MPSPHQNGHLPELQMPQLAKLESVLKVITATVVFFALLNFFTQTLIYPFFTSTSITEKALFDPTIGYRSVLVVSAFFAALSIVGFRKGYQHRLAIILAFIFMLPGYLQIGMWYLATQRVISRTGSLPNGNYFLGMTLFDSLYFVAIILLTILLIVKLLEMMIAKKANMVSQSHT
jgi:hypothetical protein